MNPDYKASYQAKSACAMTSQGKYAFPGTNLRSDQQCGCVCGTQHVRMYTARHMLARTYSPIFEGMLPR